MFYDQSRELMILEIALTSHEFYRVSLLEARSGTRAEDHIRRCILDLLQSCEDGDRGGHPNGLQHGQADRDSS
jgi:hypothetical protein